MSFLKLTPGAAKGVLALCMVSSSALSAAALAQEVEIAAPEAGAGPESGPDTSPETAVQPPAGSGQTYAPEYFTQFAPRNALEMLRRVPGFNIRDDSGGRGLGQASSNVLVNGARLSGKTDGTRDQIERISASDVVRIDIVDGATLDVPGLSGQVANLIVSVSKLSGQFEWNGEYRPLTNRLYLGRAEASISGSAGDFQFTLSAEHQGFRGGADGLISLVDAAGDPIEFQEFSGRPDRDSPEVAATLKWTPSDDLVANFNANYQASKFSNRQSEFIDGITSLDRDRQRAFIDDFYAYELGGDVEFGLGPGKLKLIGLERFENSDFVDTVIESFFNGDVDSGGRYAQISDQGERIGRVEYSWPMGGADWQIAGEAAFNRLDRVAALFETDATGALVEVDFDDAIAGVTEDRYEGSLSYGRSLSSNLTLQLIAGAEYSTLKQTGQANQTRSFLRPKGSVNLAWAPGGGYDISLTVEREVGQLSFGSFLATVQLDNDTANAGNADLVPQQSWNTDLEITKTLGKWGSATLLLFNRQIEDLVEIVPVGVDGESPGNIDSAWLRGLEFNSTIELAPLGIEGARLDLSAELRKSSVIDPLDGIERPLSRIRHRKFFAGYRHDIPRSNWAYGTELFHDKRGRRYRLTEISQDNEGPLFLQLFLEHKDVLGLTVNVSASNLLAGDNTQSRIVYDGFRDAAPIDFIETGGPKFGRILRMKVTGNF